MPIFSVRFKGLLFKTHRDRMEETGIVLQESKPALRIGSVETGEPINTVSVEADSAEDAVAKVMETLAPDDVNFTQWEGGPG